MRLAALMTLLALCAGCAALDVLAGVPPPGGAGGVATGGGSAAASGMSLLQWLFGVGGTGLAGLALEGARRGYVAHRMEKRGPSREKPRVDDHEARIRALEEAGHG
jgi:hypothetical protein